MIEDKATLRPEVTLRPEGATAVGRRSVHGHGANGLGILKIGIHGPELPIADHENGKRQILLLTRSFVCWYYRVRKFRHRVAVWTRRLVADIRAGGCRWGRGRQYRGPEQALLAPGGALFTEEARFSASRTSVS